MTANPGPDVRYGRAAGWPAPQDGERLYDTQNFAPIPDLPPVSPVRHRRAQNDLPGPSRRQLARMIRQVRTIGMIILIGTIGQIGYEVWYHVIR